MAQDGTANKPSFTRQAARERAFRLLAVTVTALFLAFAALGGAFIWYDRAAGWLNHAHEVRAEIEALRLSLTEAESAQRAFILTGDSQFSRRLEAARGGAAARIDTLARLTQDNPDQQQRLGELRDLMTARLAVIDETMAARQAGSPGAAIQIILRGEGMAAMEGVRAIASELEQEERRLQALRQHQMTVVRMVIVAALMIFAALLALLFFKALRDISLDREAEADVAERLRRLLADRTLLLDEVNHRVKNSLQQIASVVRLQSRAVEHEDAREALNKTLDRIIAVGRVHEQLYKAGDAVGAFDAGRYTESLAQDLVGSLGREDVSLETEIEHAMLDVKQAAPLALILNELITNALKYGCPADRPSRIRVAFGTDGELYRLSVADDGDGLPQDFSLSAKKSLGIRAIEALARQLGGRFEIEQPKTGASFAVVFPRS
ncbi:CHASE3 domain-containing protein [Phenylobacterium sp.]|uniref:sensor histidine kinase n=1 Tax=Phenylobacterium sp. TaxID=1871053 RepID=UPI00289F28D3|nr:CHASE3 domain-containing protein [Phenylobacterium sp.]